MRCFNRDLELARVIAEDGGSSDNKILGLVRVDGQQVPPILAQAGAEAWDHVADYFTAHIRNPNTRAADGRAVISFFWWCETHDRDSLRELRPVDIAAYVEEMAAHRAAPTVKQHLAAIRMLFDWLVVRQVLAMTRRRPSRLKDLL